MQESVLHFIWKHQYYNISKSVLDSGDSVIVLAQGISNLNAGPDFGQAKLKIKNVEWNGDVEIHIKSSDWNAHKHQFDKAYNKVILHVVWEKDKEVMREDGTFLPTLELNKLVDKKLLVKVDSLINSIATISCASQLELVSEITIIDTIQKALVKRLQRKAQVVIKELDYAKGDWEEVAYRQYMRQMGMKVNGDTFYDLALLLPYKLIRKYSHSLKSIEALLFGASGLLHSAKEDAYIKELKKEYEHLAVKHGLNRKLNPAQWKFLRLRPSNFPTLRIAQVASLLSSSTSLFKLFTEFLMEEELFQRLGNKTSSYWKSHYRFSAEAKNKVPVFGKTSADLVLLNVVAPLLAAYSLHVDGQKYIERAVKLAEHLKPEQNRILKEWKAVGIKAKSGAESQALIELYNEHCKNKSCLTCGIGFSIINN